MEFDLENPLPPSTEKFPSLFRIENDHMPTKTYLQNLISAGSDLSVRREIVSSIFLLSHEHHPFLSYLAINYMDRFLSTLTIQEWKPWVFKLVSISCISLALKMGKTTEFSVYDLMRDGGFLFNSHTIERMEMMILGALKWRMRSVNPFSFTDYFISFFNFNDDPLIQALKNRAIGIILKAQNDVKLLQFRPSIISASAVLSASYELFPVQFPSLREAICSCPYVNKENLQHCYDLMGSGSGSGSCTPANVLDLSSSISGSHSNQMSGY